MARSARQQRDGFLCAAPHLHRLSCRCSLRLPRFHPSPPHLRLPPSPLLKVKRGLVQPTMPTPCGSCRWVCSTRQPSVSVPFWPDRAGRRGLPRRSFGPPQSQRAQRAATLAFQHQKRDELRPVAVVLVPLVSLTQTSAEAASEGSSYPSRSSLGRLLLPRRPCLLVLLLIRLRAQASFLPTPTLSTSHSSLRSTRPRRRCGRRLCS